MDKLFFALFTIVYIGLLVWGLKGISTKAFKKWTSVLFVVVGALIYDNFILAIGDWIGEGELLKNLNAARFWFHAFITPLLVIFSIGTLRESGVAWVKKCWVTIIALLYMIAAIVMEVISVTADLQLKVDKAYGVVSYSSAEGPNGPPIMILMITLAMLVVSAILWKKTGWYVFFIGVVIMTIGSAVPLEIESNAITNLFELILLTSLMWTKRKLLKDELTVN
ncbi:hypothetical protein ACFOZY_04205 [Chungangia koreensis]|uniref:Phospholipid phosphatase n=1 Tax=Chungangia koreensis TaxID=752657 RepID=A0ABV8X3B3_9LACT